MAADQTRMHQATIAAHESANGVPLHLGEGTAPGKGSYI